MSQLDSCGTVLALDLQPSGPATADTLWGGSLNRLLGLKAGFLTEGGSRLLGGSGGGMGNSAAGDLPVS